MKISEIKLNSILKLSGPERYSHFVKVAADQRKVWGLYDDGWALYGTDDGREAFAIWPAQEYAEKCAVSEWGNYTPRIIPVDDLLQILVPKIKAEGGLFAVFPTPNQQGVLPDLDALTQDLVEELSRIE